MIHNVDPQLSQWDVGRIVSISNSEATHIHFANQGDSKAVIIEIENGSAKIPDYLLQTGKTVIAYAVLDGVTMESKSFPVRKRERPENYVYEDDQRNYIYELIDSAEAATKAANKAAEEANELMKVLPGVSLSPATVENKTIRIDLDSFIRDGSEISFKAPVDSSQTAGLKVYCKGEDELSIFKEFVLADANGNNVGEIDHLFAEDVVVKVILDVTNGIAFVQNADTNAYIESTFIKTVNGKKPDENGNVNVAGGGGGITEEEFAEMLEEQIDDESNSLNAKFATYGYVDEAIENISSSGGITGEELDERLVDYATLEDITSVLNEAKEYTDEAVGDIASALDELHTYAQGLINGGGA